MKKLIAVLAIISISTVAFALDFDIADKTGDSLTFKHYQAGFDREGKVVQVLVRTEVTTSQRLNDNKVMCQNQLTNLAKQAQMVQAQINIIDSQLSEIEKLKE